MPGRSVRALPLVAVAAMLTGTPAAGAAEPPTAHTLRLVAQARRDARLTPYATAADLAGIAARHAARLAQEKRLYHNPNFDRDVGPRRRGGENVDAGTDPDDVHRDVMASPPHRANVLDPGFTEVGIGTARGADGLLYVVEVFRQRRTAARRPTARQVRPRPGSELVAAAVPAPPSPAPGPPSAVASPPADRPALTWAAVGRAFRRLINLVLRAASPATSRRPGLALARAPPPGRCAGTRATRLAPRIRPGVPSATPPVRLPGGRARPPGPRKEFGHAPSLHPRRHRRRRDRDRGVARRVRRVRRRVLGRRRPRPVAPARPA